MMRDVPRLLSLVLVAALSQIILAVDTPTSAPAPPSKEELEAIAVQVQSNDPASIDSALTKIKSWQMQRIAPSADMIKVWMPALLETQRNQEVADICLEEILLTPSIGNVRDFFPSRITALQKLNRNDEALQAAKSMYNGCDIKNVDKVIPLVAHALELVHPDDKTVGPRFTLEQAQSTGKRDPAAGASTAATLKSVKIDQKLYEKALVDWEAKSKNSLQDMEKYANLLLIADKGEEGEKLFREMVPKGAGDGARYKAGVLRALKAEDGNLARATAAAEIANDKALP